MSKLQERNVSIPGPVEGTTYERNMPSPISQTEPVIAADPHPAQPSPKDAGAHRDNLPDHDDPATKNFIRQLRRDVVIRRGADEDGVEDVQAIRLHATCPVKGCKYPLVERIKDGAGYHIKPQGWGGKSFLMCLWDPAHYEREIDPQ